MTQPTFSETDIALLCRIAAGHLHFGQFETARRLLRLALWLDETHEEALTLWAHTAVRAQAHEEFHLAMARLKANAYDIPADLAGVFRHMPNPAHDF